jgi:hypothetical protein
MKNITIKVPLPAGSGRSRPILSEGLQGFAPVSAGFGWTQGRSKPETGGLAKSELAETARHWLHERSHRSAGDAWFLRPEVNRFPRRDHSASSALTVYSTNRAGSGDVDINRRF